MLIVNDTIDIAAPPARVWQLLTEPAWTRRYMFDCEAVSDWRVGSPLLWTARVDGKDVVFVKGAVVEHTPPRVLAYTVFDPNMGIADVPENYLTVTCRLAPHDGGTRLEVAQGDYASVANGEERHRHTVAGWRQVLDKIKALAEEG